MSNVTMGRFIAHLDDLQDQCLNNDLDAVGLITGTEGKGKSGLAFVASKYLNKRLGVPFDPERQVHWTGKPYMQESQKFKPGTPMIMDELVGSGTSYDFMSKSNKSLADYLTVCRERNLVHWLINPSLRYTSPIIKEHRAFYEYKVIRRYKEHAVAKVSMLRDEDVVYEKPRHLFTFSYPKPRGPDWERILQRKRQFGALMASDRVEESDAYVEFKETLRQRLQPLLADFR